MPRIFSEFCDEKWKQIREHSYYATFRERVIRKACEYMTTEPPIVRFSQIHRYVLDGNREQFESVHTEYFDRMKCFFNAYLLTEDEKYLTPLADSIWNVCDLESWSIPAHVAETLPIDERRKNLDLCSTIAGSELAEVIYYVGDKLPELVKRRALAEIRYRVIDSYKNFAPKRYWWPEATNNWSAVCIAAVLDTFIFAGTEEETRAELPRMIESAKCYLRGFTSDGCCGEGYSYWVYGFSFFCIFARLVEEFTDGEINLFEDELVKKIAHFQECVPLNERECVNFSDAPSAFNPPTWLTHFLKKKYPNLKIPALQSQCVAGSRLRDILWEDPDLCKSSLNATEPFSFSFPEAQWFIYRNTKYAFACKAGHNEEQHNHNDVGSFIFSVGDGVTFADSGVGQYTRQYFSPERYELMVCSSRGHSVPIINGEYQVQSADKAEIYIHEPTRYCYSVEKVYKVESLKKLTRDFKMEEEYVTLTDTYEFTEAPSSVVERFIALRPIEIIENGKIKCGDATLTYDGALFEATLGSEEVERKQGKVGTVYYVDLAIKNPTTTFAVTFKFE